MAKGTQKIPSRLGLYLKRDREILQIQNLKLFYSFYQSPGKVLSNPLKVEILKFMLLAFAQLVQLTIHMQPLINMELLSVVN